MRDDPTGRLDPSGYGPVGLDGNPFALIHMPRCPAVDPFADPPYDDTKLPPNDPGYAKLTPDGTGREYPNWTIDGDPNHKFTWICYKKQNCFFLRAPNGDLVHRCSYEGGGNGGSVTPVGGWLGWNKCPTEGYETAYLYDPRTRTVRIYCKVAGKDRKPVVIEKPTDPCKFPKSPGPPR